MKPKVLLSARGQIDCVDCGLRSVAGAQGIIAKITCRRVVTKLILSHNELSDDGCIVLFTFLNSAMGRKYHITEISLNSNGISDRGLEAISSYLVGNVHLRELYLQNNNLTANPGVVLTFARAINRSQLRFLSLTTNRALSDAFAQRFIPALDCPTLGELHLSATDITYRSAACISDYITSPRCQLHTLRLNGNHLGFRGARKIIGALESANFTLLSLELHANQIAVGMDGSDNTSDEDEGEQIGPESWKHCETLLQRVVTRNRHLKQAVEKEALELLVCSRAVLLRSGRGFVQDTGASLEACSDSCSCVPDSAARITEITSIGTNRFPFTSFPTELQLYILSFLAPTLSPMQRVNIFTYASSPTTLPQLLPCLSSSSSTSSPKLCIPDPTTSMMGTSGLGQAELSPELGTLNIGSNNLNSTPSTSKRPVWSVVGGQRGGCASGKCMGGTGSVLCHRMQERTRWLEAVRCTAYDATGQTK
ncbi:protein nlrc3 [Moniliophthora roreri]|uniref:Putative RNI-like protein n=1 Tax=Moniliophthora roreri TaxID=221103 RepID=A0A0W0ETM4_MONRR|nr:protein nlrc3 [Moniliophthora roreri]